MASNKLPVLYATQLSGFLFKHCSIHPALYFELVPNEELAARDANYRPYFERAQQEALAGIINKFTFYQATKITNNRVPFVIFRSNMERGIAKQFCQLIVDEFSHFTEAKHTARFMYTDALLMEMGRRPSILKAHRVGDKLSETDFMGLYGETLTTNDTPGDAGILTPYSDFVDESDENDDDIVPWG